MLKQRNTEELRRDFLTPPDRYRAVPFVRIDGDLADEEKMNAVLASIRDAGYGGIAPVPVMDMRRTKTATTPEIGSDAYWDAYGKLLEKAKALGLSVIYYDDADFPSGRYANKVVENYPEAAAQVLDMREYSCTEGEITKRKLDTNGVTMSVVAYEVDTGEVLDIRDDVIGDTLVWDTPDGNWNVLQFICHPVPDTPFVNFLNYDASMRFVEMSYKPFCERFSNYFGEVVKLAWYDDLQYEAPNRRMWSPDFNEVFEQEYGFDPAPYYPAMFFDIARKEFYCTYLMKCRAKMFADGFFRAVSDFTKQYGLPCAGHLSESKTAAVSNLFGDAMQLHEYADAVGVDMLHAYMYGFNGLKMASSAAYNYGKELVICEIFKNYSRLDRKVLYKETMNVFARGVNAVMPNVMQWSGDKTYNHDVSMQNPEYRDILPQYNAFVARCQAMLQGGQHVSDIAILYPINAMHADVYLYDQKETHYQFSPVLQFADYMSDINAVLNYCGRDVTVLHPEVFCEKGRAEGGLLHIDSEINPESFRILILPAATMMSVRVMRIVKKFYDCGGKVVATCKLPFQIIEDTDEARAEAADILDTMFGIREDTANYVSDYEMHTNENGGMAIYLRSSMTDLDGTLYVEANRLNETLWSFDTPVDIVFEHLPRIAHSGILALNLIAFRNSGAAVEGIRSGGVFNYIHKRHDGCDVYYVSNTTIRDYNGNILINGCYTVEEWNPHTGSIRLLDGHLDYVGGIPYTTIVGSIPADTCVFLVCKPAQPDENTEIGQYADFAALRKYYHTLEGKKNVNKHPRLFPWQF